MSNIWYTLFVCMCLYCVSWWCYLGTGHLIGSWSLTAQGYILDWLGDVISTVSFCQLSGGVCYPTNLCMNCRLHMDLCQTYGVCNYAFCIIIFVLVFCLCFVYKFHYILESVYWFHSKVVHLANMPVFVLCLNLSSQWILCHILSVHYAVTYANHTFGGHWHYKQADILT